MSDHPNHTRLMHCSLSIDASWDVWGRGITVNGRPMTAFEFDELRAKLKADGYTVFPNAKCDHYDQYGCLGHRIIGYACPNGHPPSVGAWDQPGSAPNHGFWSRCGECGVLLEDVIESRQNAGATP